MNVVTGTGPAAGDPLVRHPDVAKISFTGSTVTGRAIGALASDALKKVTLELGGKSPTIVFADAELDRAAEGAADLIFLNSGQVCVAGSRLYVERGAVDRVVEAVATRAASLKVGAGLDPATQIAAGQHASAKPRARLCRGRQIGRRDAADRRGAADAAGFYVPPTVLVDVRQDMKVVQEEVFGPVLAVMPFDDVDEVVERASDTVYGLAATIWTQNLKKAHSLIPRLKCGYVAVNSDAIPHAALPQGGLKQSRVGKDLGTRGGRRLS